MMAMTALRGTGERNIQGPGDEITSSQQAIPCNLLQGQDAVQGA